MIVVKLMGGLGNQMFQYAAAKTLANFHKTTIKVDLSFLLDRTPRENFTFRDYDLDIFVADIKKASTEEVKPYFTKPNKFKRVITSYFKTNPTHSYYAESGFHFNQSFFNLSANCYIEGYWQSRFYFSEIEHQLRNDFIFRDPIKESSLELLKIILETNSVCINIRRTDFLNNSFHGICDMNYYFPAMEKLRSIVKNPHYFIFTDDHTWAIENFKVQAPVTIVGPEHDGNKFSNKFQLMTMCKNFIIPNSSFAWWAAWLSKNPEKIVLGPTNWFSDPNSTTHELQFGNWISIKN